jgi:hypothetical protein
MNGVEPLLEAGNHLVALRAGSRRLIHGERLFNGAGGLGIRLRRRRFQLACKLGDDFLQIRIVAREGQRRAVLFERERERSLTAMDVGEGADRGKVVGCASEHVFELDERHVEIVQLEQCTAERDPRGRIARMQLQTRPADGDGLQMEAGTPALLGELCEGNRRRILLDPAAKVINPLTVRHVDYGTVTAAVLVPVRPRLSVTVSLTV